MTKLSDTQRIILSAAAQNEDLIALPLPNTLRGGAAAKVVGALIAKGFLEEVEAKRIALHPISAIRFGARPATATASRWSPPTQASQPSGLRLRARTLRLPSRAGSGGRSGRGLRPVSGAGTRSTAGCSTST